MKRMEGSVGSLSIQLEHCVGEKDTWAGEGHLIGGPKGLGSFCWVALAE